MALHHIGPFLLFHTWDPSMRARNLLPDPAVPIGFLKLSRCRNVDRGLVSLRCGRTLINRPPSANTDLPKCRRVRN
jgi:hypothetical protein